jgi:hypothetical protein
MELTVNFRQQELAGSAVDEIRDLGREFCERWAAFPTSRLLITVNHHARKRDYHVKATACLPMGRAFMGSRGDDLIGLVDASLDKLSRKLESWTERLEGREHYGDARREREQASLPDPARLQQAADAGDAARFRQILAAHDEPLGLMLKAKLGAHHSLRDDPDPARLTGIAIDYVYLTAFDEFEHRPSALTFRDWLFSLADEVLDELAVRQEEIEEEVMLFRSSGGSDSR